MAAATLVTLAGCGPAEDPAGDGTEDEADGDAGQDAPDERDTGGADPAADGNEDEDRTSVEEVHGSAERRALVFIHVVETERLIDEDGDMRLPSANLAEIIQGMGGWPRIPRPELRRLPARKACAT